MNESVTVLAVDDEPNNLRALRLDLEDAGYDVLCAKDGIEAWDTLEKNRGKIKTILLDRMMPNMNGMEVISKIKEDSGLSGIPVIMQTAAAEKEQVVEGIKAGAYYYLTKPYEKEVMLSIVFAAVNDYAQYRRLRDEIRQFTRKLALVKEARVEARSLDDVQYLSTFLSQLFPNPERVVFGLSELLTNAVEHGNLGITYEEKTELNHNGSWHAEIERRLSLPEYAEKIVTVSYLREDHSITLDIRDGGNGFNWKDYMDISPDRATHNHGRGIALSKMMSFDHIEYIGCGNEVICKVAL